MTSMSAALPLVPRYNTAPPAAPPAPSAPSTPSTPSTPAQDEDKSDITIGQAARGIFSGILVGGIETVGNTASSFIQAPRAAAHAYKALWNTDQIGRVLKVAIGGIALPAALVAAPILTALGSAGFGVYRGFSESLEKGVVGAVEAGVKDVKFFNTELAGWLIKGIQEFELEKLPPGDKPYDIRVIEAGQGLVGGVAAAVVDGIGCGAITLARTPRGTYKALKAIWNSDQGPVLKTTETVFLLPVAVVLATPLATVGGALWGLATGFKEGYTNGVVAAGAKGLENVKDFEKMTREALND